MLINARSDSNFHPGNLETSFGSTLLKEALFMKNALLALMVGILFLIAVGGRAAEIPVSEATVPMR